MLGTVGLGAVAGVGGSVSSVRSTTLLPATGFCGVAAAEAVVAAEGPLEEAAVAGVAGVVGVAGAAARAASF